MGLHNFSLYQLFQHNARTAGDQPALIGAEGTLTHSQFLTHIDRLAAGLTDREINQEDRVAILAQNSNEYLEIYGACAKIGAVACPISWRLSSDEIKAVIELIDPHMLIADSEHLPQLEGTHTAPFQRVAITETDAPPEGFTSFRDLYHTGTEPPTEVDSDSPFLILPTAAVTGLPRGAVLTHENLIWGGYQLITALGLRPQDRHLAILPFFHVTGLGLSLSVLQARGANVVMKKFDPVQANQWMDERNITLMADFPPVLSSLLDAREEANGHWDNLRFVVGLDAPDVIERLYNETDAAFWTGFGQAETTGAVTLGRVDEQPGSAGTPLPLMRVRCVDEDGKDVPSGQSGEIVVRGPQVFSGYWRDPDATDFVFRQDWHHTGDVGKLDQNGYLYYIGRKPEKKLIKSGGENVYPEEVERVIRELPQVEAVCVVGVPDEKWGEAVKAVVELKSGQSLSTDQVISAVSEKIASYKKPRHVDFVETLPRTEEDEIDREAVENEYG